MAPQKVEGAAAAAAVEMGSGSGEPTVACRNKALGCSSRLANQKSEKRHAVRCKFKFKPADGNPASGRMSDATSEAATVDVELGSVLLHLLQQGVELTPER